MAILLLYSSMGMAAADAGMQLYMPDGQLESHPVRIYIDHDISDAMVPELRLIGNRAFIDLKNRGTIGKAAIKPMVLARHQQWMQMKGGYNTAATGTLMLFDLSHATSHWYQPVKKYTPTLIWREHGTEQRAIGSREVYVVNRIGVFFWTFLLIMIFAGFIVWQSKILHDGKRHQGSAMGMLRDADGYLSLSRVQVVCWTLAAWLPAMD